MIYNNIVIGLDANNNIDELLSSGIKQFYIGYIPKVWSNKYHSQQSLNRRYLHKEQIYDIELLENIFDTVKSKNAKIYLTLNAPFSNEEMLLYSTSLLDEISHIKFDSYIGGNIPILQLLKQRELPITLSTTLGAYTSSSVEFFIKTFQPTRVILPRDMMLHEIESIVMKYPDSEFEVFLYGDSCRWSDGYCFVEHGYDSIDKGLPFCMHLKDGAKPLQRLDPLFKAKLKNGTLSSTAIIKKPSLSQSVFTEKESF